MTKYEVEWTAKKRAATSCLTYWISTRSRCRVCSIFCCWSNLPFGEVLDIHFRLCDSLMSPKKKTNTMSLSFSVALLLLSSIFFWKFSLASRKNCTSLRNLFPFSLAYAGVFSCCVPCASIHWFFKHTPHTQNKHKLWQYKNKPRYKA